MKNLVKLKQGVRTFNCSSCLF